MLAYSGSNPANHEETHWVIQPAGSGYYALRSISGRNFLDGRVPGYNDPVLAHGDEDPTSVEVVHWKIIKLVSGRYAILSRTSDQYLDGRRPGYQDPFIGYSKKNPNEHEELEWSFIPVNYKLKLELSDFRYDNAEQLLLQSKRLDLIDSHTLIVDESTVGSSIQRTFSKSLTESFSWGLNEKLTVGAEFKIKATIPLLGAAETTIKTSLEVGSSQQWTETTQRTVAVSATMVARVTGSYKMEGFVYVADNVKLNFTAKLSATANGTRVSTRGEYVATDTPLDAVAVESILKTTGYKSPIISSNGSSVVMSISGTLNGTYGLNTTTNIVKVT